MRRWMKPGLQSAAKLALAVCVALGCYSAGSAFSNRVIQVSRSYDLTGLEDLTYPLSLAQVQVVEKGLAWSPGGVEVAYASSTPLSNGGASGEPFESAGYILLAPGGRVDASCNR